MTDTHGTGADYPATFTLDPPDHVANWRPLVHWLLAIPHLVLLWALGTVSEVAAVISWFAIVFTGKLPAGLARFQAMYVRYYLRTMSYVGFLREEYPPFTFADTPGDPGDDPRVRVDLVPAVESRNRLTVGFRLILVIPQIIILALLVVALVIVGVIAGIAVLITGRWPAGLQAFALGVARWWLRVQAYNLLLTDEYPPFAFGDLGGTAPQAVPSPA